MLYFSRQSLVDKDDLVVSAKAAILNHGNLHYEATLYCLQRSFHDGSHVHLTTLRGPI